jgi:hypothetical protein
VREAITASAAVTEVKRFEKTDIVDPFPMAL